jgi:hypothetical protein
MVFQLISCVDIQVGIVICKVTKPLALLFFVCWTHLIGLSTKLDQLFHDKWIDDLCEISGAWDVSGLEKVSFNLSLQWGKAQVYHPFIGITNFWNWDNNFHIFGLSRVMSLILIAIGHILSWNLWYIWRKWI